MAASKYWIGNEPSSNVSSEEAQDLAQLAKDVSVGVVNALDGDDSPGEGEVNATKCLKVTIAGVDYFIPCYIANVAS